MACVPFRIGATTAIVCTGGPEYKMRIGRRVVRFEDHRIFGPSLTTIGGDICVRQPGENHPFWNQYDLWCELGKRVDDDGFAITTDHAMHNAPATEDK